jgi:sortase family protein
MARTWRSSVLAHVSAKLVGEAMLAVLLAFTLVFSWRDAVPADNYVFAIGSPTSSAPAPENGLRLGRPAQVSSSHSVALAPVPQAQIPTAPPVQILIPDLNVHRAVEAVGVGRSGVIDVPVNAWNAGWYNGGPVPGAPGDSVIEGHAGYPGQPMIFGKLATLRPGAQVVVVLSDGSRQLFLVGSMSSVPVGTAPPGFAEPYGPPRLTLITCNGHFDDNSYSYSSRLVVELTYSGPV